METRVRSVFLAASILLLTPGVGTTQTINRIVFFGDSLSDSGNHFIATGMSSQQPFTLDAPIASYDIGGHHFSDGASWAEQLATALHLPDSGKPSLRAPGLFGNYAVGRARARANAPEFPDFALYSQVQSYLSDVGGQVPSDTLIAIWIGGNDVSDAIRAFLDDRTGASSYTILNSALVSMAGNISLLYAAGARMFLIVNIPDFAYTPYVRFLDASGYAGIASVATALTTAYDGALKQLADHLPPLLLNRFVDANALIGQIVSTPSEFGLTNVFDRCTTPDVVGGALCRTPRRYLFWDAVHPTRAGHQALTQAALQALLAQ